jgi:sulfur-oxidizing protein SoxX
MTWQIHAARVAVVLATAVAVGCAGAPAAPSSAELDVAALTMIRGSFRDQGIAKLDRLEQDATQRACSGEKPLAEAPAKALQAEALKTIQWPRDGRFLGDWREGEKLAQNGRGMTWTDSSTAPAANGGNCYNCHQVDKKEISFGTIGPSLWNYGKLRGVSNPADPAAKPMLEYTWGKLWNSKASAACSIMPRFGHAKLLDEEQLRHLMALLLDPKSPVNQ